MLQKNEVITNPDNPYGLPDLPALAPAGESRSKGVGIDLSGSITDNLTLIGNVSWVDAYIESNPSNPILEGRRITNGQNGPSRSAALAMRYSFTEGMLDGLRLGVNMTYQNAYLRAYDSYTSAGVLAGTEIWMPSRVEWGMMAAYSFDLPKNRVLSFRVTVMNLFDNMATLPFGTTYPPGREARFGMWFHF